MAGGKAAGGIARLPLALDVSTTDVYPEGQAEPRAEEMPSAIYESVSPAYFATMGIPIVAGRDFAGSDIARSPGVVIVNETLAQRFWPSQNAIGKRLHSGNTDVLEVVGVDRKSTRLNSSHGYISYAVFCLKKTNAPAASARSFSSRSTACETADALPPRISQARSQTSSGSPTRRAISMSDDVPTSPCRNRY